MILDLPILIFLLNTKKVVIGALIIRIGTKIKWITGIKIAKIVTTINAKNTLRLDLILLSNERVITCVSHVVVLPLQLVATKFNVWIEWLNFDLY